MVKGFNRSASFFVQRYKKIGQFDQTYNSIFVPHGSLFVRINHYLSIRNQNGELRKRLGVSVGQNGESFC